MHGCKPRNFLQPCLLLLLLDGPAHGYDLIRRLEPYDVTHDDPGHVYRGLRALESAGMVSSAWVPSDCGPARRVYEITGHGRKALERWIPELEGMRALIGRYLSDYAAHDGAVSRPAGIPAPRAVVAP
jgi:PadR family transcriptional regulator PadR